MKKFVFGGMVFLMMVVMTTIVSADSLKEGKWSMTMVTKIENLPPQLAAYMGHGMAITVTQCITKQNPVPNHVKNPEYCQQTHDFNGNTVNFHMTCDRNNTQIESSGRMTYTGDSMQGEIKTHQVTSGKAMDSTVDITGQYLGPC